MCSIMTQIQVTVAQTADPRFLDTEHDVVPRDHDPVIVFCSDWSAGIVRNSAKGRSRWIFRRLGSALFPRPCHAGGGRFRRLSRGLEHFPDQICRHHVGHQKPSYPQTRAAPKRFCRHSRSVSSNKTDSERSNKTARRVMSHARSRQFRDDVAAPLKLMRSVMHWCGTNTSTTRVVAPFC